MTLFSTWRGWMMAASAAVGFVCGAAVLVRAAQFWHEGPNPYADPAVVPLSHYGLFWAALLVAGAVAAFWKRQPLVLMAAWALCLGGMLYDLTFIFVPSIRETYGLPPPDFKAVLSALAVLALPIAGLLLPLPAWFDARRDHATYVSRNGAS